MQLGFSPRPITDVRPHQVPGFREAWAAGRLPVVAEHPPRLLPGRSAESIFWRRLALLGGGVVLHLLVVDQVVPRLPALLGALVMLGGGLAFFWYLLRTFAVTGERNLEELAHGYTTVTMVFGDFWYGGRRFRGHRMPWDYSGAWHLHRTTGAVLAAPRRWLEPPGYYPSPVDPGSDELWTGVAWSGHRRARRP